jgi:hypothetical protein
VALITTAACTLLTLLSLSTTGGKGLGPRLTMGLWPLLAAAALEGLDSWRRWAGTAWVRRPIVWGGALLVAGSVVMELGVALPALAVRLHEDQEALALIRQIPISRRPRRRHFDAARRTEYFNREVLFVRGSDCGAARQRARGRWSTRLLVSRGSRVTPRGSRRSVRSRGPSRATGSGGGW